MAVALFVAVLFAQSRTPSAQAALLKTLVFTTCGDAGPASLPGEVQLRVREVAERCAAFTPRVRSLPGLTAGEREMTDIARRGYERRLWTVARDSTPRTAALAAAYVEALAPCYEWEGYHDCPEHEAVFADNYVKDHRSSPFVDYLPLLAAHRWQCAVEAYEYEAQNHVRNVRGSVGIAEARRRGASDLAQARRSADPLVRYAAETLKERGACF